MMIATTFMLVTVTYGGVVGRVGGFKTLGDCEQAKSIALTGMTIAENEAADATYKAAIEQEATDWRKAHPPRRPTKEELRSWEKGQSLGSSGPYTTIDAEGMALDWPGSSMNGIVTSAGEWAELVRGQWRRKGPGDIKVAVCAPEEQREIRVQ